jgi:hypothetical protein
MTKKQHDAILADAEWVADFPIPLEDFGKDFLNTLRGLQGYKKSWGNNIALRQTANCVRKNILANSNGLIDIINMPRSY